MDEEKNIPPVSHFNIFASMEAALHAGTPKASALPTGQQDPNFERPDFFKGMEAALHGAPRQTPKSTRVEDGDVPAEVSQHILDFFQ